jgi:Domain of unknown function (DUF3806)
MGLFDRLRGRDADDATEDAGTDGSGGSELEGVEPMEEIGIRRLTPEDESTLDAVRARYAEHGIDPSDLDSIAAAYDRALDAGEGAVESSDLVALIGTAMGDHLVGTAGHRWVVSTDPFGTDLAVEPPRHGIPVVTRTLVAVRWMGRERGWIPGVTGHLARAGRG